MPVRLYLDTARLGRMSQRAQRAQIDFVRLAGEEGCTLYWERFLRDGFDAWPPQMQERYTGLSDWQGIQHLRASLAQLTGVADPSRVLLANRSAELVRLAARTMFRRCERVLVTDLTWPSYARILEDQRRRLRKRISTVPIRQAIFRDRVPLGEVVQRIVTAYRANQCDGLFLPAVSHDGIRLPLRMIYRAVCRDRAPQFVAVDGAQAFCHAPVNLAGDWCDIFVAGCHKWLGGHIPMGIAVLPHVESAIIIKHTIDRRLRDGHWHDPLLRFIWQVEHKSRDRFSETVNLSGLFSCQASLAEWLERPYAVQRQFKHQLANGRQLAELAEDSGWQPLQPSPCFRSGIILLKANRADSTIKQTHSIRARFRRSGIAVTTYPGETTRLSMPREPWTDGALDHVQTVLQRCLDRCVSSSAVGSMAESPYVPQALAL